MFRKQITPALNILHIHRMWWMWHLEGLLSKLIIYGWQGNLLLKHLWQCRARWKGRSLLWLATWFGCQAARYTASPPQGSFSWFNTICYFKLEDLNILVLVVNLLMHCQVPHVTCHQSPDHYPMKHQLLWKSQEVWWCSCGRFGDISNKKVPFLAPSPFFYCLSNLRNTFFN